MRKSEHNKQNGKGWWKGLMFGGLIGSALTFFTASKTGDQAKKKIKAIKKKGTASGKKLVANSKTHAKEFAKSTKKLAKDISKDLSEFKKSMTSRDHYKE
ncbi:MAG: hypothetical protein RSB82_01770 [Victivallaceae bacterium]